MIIKTLLIALILFFGLFMFFVIAILFALIHYIWTTDFEEKFRFCSRRPTQN